MPTIPDIPDTLKLALADETYQDAVLFIIGALTHALVFRRGEWDRYGSRIGLSVVGLYLGSTAGSIFYIKDGDYGYDDEARNIAKHIFYLFSVFFGGLFTSMLVYRAFFHPLRHFPGPFLARLSSMYPVFLSAKNLHLYKETTRLHETYGDFVRLGPRHISISHPAGVAALHTNTSPCQKGPFYHAMDPNTSTHTTRNPVDHARRRKPWDIGLSMKSLRNYESRVAQYNDQLIAALDNFEGKPFNMAKQANLYSFDVMGSLAFSKDFHMVKDQELAPAVRMLHSTMKVAGIFNHIMWFFLIARYIPGATAEFNAFKRWIRDEMFERMKNEPKIPDIFSPLQSAYDSLKKPTPKDQYELEGDTMLIVVAGSDTTAASLTCLFLEMALNPAKYKKLQTEVDAHYSRNLKTADGHDDLVALQELPYLQACINEALRLHPVLPSGVQRTTPPQGLMVGETYIPGNMLVQVPMHSAFRDERAFVRPDEYVPERWTDEEPGLILNGKVYAPFLIGRYACAGKQLALMELRSVLARVASRYDIRLAKEQKMDAFEKSLIDGFTLTTPRLDLVFTKRTTKT